MEEVIATPDKMKVAELRTVLEAKGLDTKGGHSAFCLTGNFRFALNTKYLPTF